MITNLNLRHLACFEEVAKHRSISAAAKTVHLTQPAVTQAMGSLESFFGTSLLARASTGVSLTPAGQICWHRAERALGHLREAVLDLAGTPNRNAAHWLRTQQLRALVAVVEHRSFTIAARATGVSQPAIYRAARDLERALGVALFEKTSFGVLPTRAAERFARGIKLAFGEISQAQAEIEALQGRDVGRTVIAALPLARSHLIPSALLDFSNEYPQHAILILDGTYDHLLSALRFGEADFMIGALRDPPPVEDIVQQYWFDDPLAIIVRVGHPLASKKHITVNELSGFGWIAPRPGTPLRVHFDTLFASTAVRSQQRPIECNSLIAARSILMESDRIMLLSRHQIHYELRAGLLVALPHPLGRVVRPIGITMRADWHPTPAQDRLLFLLRERVSNEFGTDIAEAPELTER